MALSSSKLQTALRRLVDPSYYASPTDKFVGHPSGIGAAAANFAAAYASYATDGTDVAGNALTAYNQPGFASALTSLTTQGDATTAATAFANAFVAFWSAATFDTAKSPTTGVGGTTVYSKVLSSAVTTVVGTALQAALLAAFGVRTTDGAAKAASLATAFHSATLSSIVVVVGGLDTTPPSAGPLPIVNTGVVS